MPRDPTTGLPAVPGALLGAETGLADSNWVSDTRDALRDTPAWVKDTFTGNAADGVLAANAIPWVLTRKPIYDNATTAIKVTVGGVAQTVIFAGTPTANQVLVNPDTGELTFSAAPGNGVVVNISYQMVRWTDQSLLTALYAGLRAMFPRVGKTYVDTADNIQTNVWDYQLPSWCSDPRAQIYSVQVIDPNIATEPYKPLAVWERTGLDLLTIPRSQMYSPAAKLRIQGWGPYLTLGDLEPQLYHLPIWYALGTLLSKQEAPRVREDTTVPLANEGGVQPMVQATLGKHYLDLFENELNRLKRAIGPGVRKRFVTTYERANFG